MLAFDGRRLVARVFPTHYPASPEVFYAGLELFVLRDPTQVTVGGIQDGPASKAGIHWGDVLISVNEVPLAGKTPCELEQIFTATQPALMSWTKNHYSCSGPRGRSRTLNSSFQRRPSRATHHNCSMPVSVTTVSNETGTTSAPS